MVRKIVIALFLFKLNIRRNNRPSTAITAEFRTGSGPNTRPAASNSSEVDRLTLVSNGQTSLNRN